jgi:hypothetical protein
VVVGAAVDVGAPVASTVVSGALVAESRVVAFEAESSLHAATNRAAIRTGSTSDRERMVGIVPRGRPPCSVVADSDCRIARGIGAASRYRADPSSGLARRQVATWPSG